MNFEGQDISHFGCNINVFIQAKLVTLADERTYSTGIRSWIGSAAVVCGTLVLCGMVKGVDGAVLCFFRPGGRGLKEVGSQVWCAHPYSVRTESLEIGRRQILAVNCSQCRKIWLRSMETGGTSVAFESKKFCIGPICRGEPGQLIVRGQNQFVFLDCSTPRFRLIKHVYLTWSSAPTICYIPTAGVLTVQSQSGLVSGLSADTGEQVWQEQKVSSPSLEHCGMAYSPEHDALFVAGRRNIRVLNPSDGSLRQVLPLEKEELWGMCVHNDQLVVVHGDILRGEVKVSCFSLK